jgi:hypothetical protein
LEEFTKLDTSSFCLAHIFTFRDFPAGIQGLAYKETVCSTSHNTGFTTFLNHKVSWPKKFSHIRAWYSKGECICRFG